MSSFTFVGRITPKKLKDRYKQALSYSTIKVDIDDFMGKIMVYGMLLSFMFGLLAQELVDLALIVLFASLFLVFEVVIYFWISLSASRKAEIVDEALPDALQLMSSNIRAGLTTDKALIMAARPEFGPLEEEIRRIGKETMAGKSLVASLQKTKDHIHSKDLDRTIELMIYSIQSGGQLADLLDQTAADIRSQQMMRKEISASVLMYVMFIFIAIALGAPALFGLSGFLGEMLTSNMGMIAEQLPSDFGGGGGGAAPISVSKISITPEFLETYSLISLAVSCFFGSMVVGLILKGEEKEGLQYMPVMYGIAIVLFFIVKYILRTFLGSMLVT